MGQKDLVRKRKERRVEGKKGGGPGGKNGEELDTKTVEKIDRPSPQGHFPGYKSMEGHIVGPRVNQTEKGGVWMMI